MVGDGTVYAMGPFGRTVNESSMPEDGMSGSVPNSDVCETGAATSGDPVGTEEG